MSIGDVLKQCELGKGPYRCVLWIPIQEAREGNVINEWAVRTVYQTRRIIGPEFDTYHWN